MDLESYLFGFFFLLILYVSSDKKNLSVPLTGLNRKYLSVIFLLAADALVLLKISFDFIIHLTPKPNEIILGEKVLLCWQVQIKRSYQNNLTFSI